MARGEQEQSCFDFSKDYLNRNQLPSFEDWAILKKTFQTAIPNPQSSNFPDFICEDGFIEHFQVTSAKETSRGSEQMKMQADFDKACKKEFEKIQKEPPTFSVPIEMQTTTMEMPFLDCSYDNYIKSFKKNWEHHIESLKNYEGNINMGVFLIEHTGAPIVIKRHGKFQNFYHLQMDENLLNYLYDYTDMIQYVLYCHSEFCDVICLEKIPEIKRFLPHGRGFGVGRSMNISSLLICNINPNLL